MKHHIAAIVVTVTLVLSAAFGWIIVEGTRGEPGLQNWQSPLRISVYNGHNYIFVTWDTP